jgi:hypothetical protein
MILLFGSAAAALFARGRMVRQRKKGDDGK